MNSTKPLKRAFYFIWWMPMTTKTQLKMLYYLLVMVPLFSNFIFLVFEYLRLKLSIPRARSNTRTAGSGRNDLKVGKMA